MLAVILLAIAGLAVLAAWLDRCLEDEAADHEEFVAQVHDRAWGDALDAIWADRRVA